MKFLFNFLVSALFVWGTFSVMGCKKDPPAPVVPTLTTTAPTNITNSSASVGGFITEDGGADITDRGICYGTAASPTVANSVVASGIGVGNFTAAISSLTAGTVYYARAYAKNSAGIAYGNEVTFTTTVALGQLYAGGYVFYLDNTGIHGMVVSQTNTGSSVWGCYGTNIPGAYSPAIGGGISNTTAITQGCSGGSAAKLCSDLVQEGYDDWYLPTSGDLALIYQNVHSQGLGNFINTSYWSSTSYSASYAYAFKFYDGSAGYDSKNTLFPVRAIRNF